ncbi:hypothetical protein [Nonomuraea sp. NPDC050202]
MGGTRRWRRAWPSWEARLAVVEGRDMIEVSTLASEKPRMVEL